MNAIFQCPDVFKRLSLKFSWLLAAAGWGKWKFLPKCKTETATRPEPR